MDNDEEDEAKVVGKSEKDMKVMKDEEGTITRRITTNNIMIISRR